MPDAAAYNPLQPGPHLLVLLSASGGPCVEDREEQTQTGQSNQVRDDWSARVPQDWSPASTGAVQLVALVGHEREIDLGSQSYLGGPAISRYRYEVDVEVREARTGQKVRGYTFSGADPPPFPKTAPVPQTRLEGAHYTYQELEAWLCPLVTSSGCWTRLQTQPATQALLSPDGEVLAAAAFDGTLQLLRVSDGAVLRTLAGHSNSVSARAFSPDGSTLASGSSDGAFRLWRVSDGAPLRQIDAVRGLEGYPSGVVSLAFSPDGSTVSTIVQWIADDYSERRAVQLWRVADGALLRQAEARQKGSWLTQAVFSPDGATLAALTEDLAVQLWDAAGGALLQTIEGHTGTVNDVAFSPDGKTLATASEDATVRIWQVADGAPIRTLDGQADSVTRVTFSPDGSTLASEALHGVKLWRLADGALLATLEPIAGTEPGVAFSPDGQTVATWSYATAHLWRASDAALLRALGGSPGWLQSLAFSPDGDTLVTLTAALDGLDGGPGVQLWRVSDGRQLRTLTQQASANPAFVFSADGRTLILNASTTVEVWRMQ